MMCKRHIVDCASASMLAASSEVETSTKSSDYHGKLEHFTGPLDPATRMKGRNRVAIGPIVESRVDSN